MISMIILPVPSTYFKRVYINNRWINNDINDHYERVLATASCDAYDSEYDHGCDDSDFENPGDRYINQPGNGSSKQSDEFMNGYEDGFNACNDKGYENTSNFPELDQGERYGRCEERSIGLVCDIEENRK